VLTVSVVESLYSTNYLVLAPITPPETVKPVRHP